MSTRRTRRRNRGRRKERVAPGFSLPPGLRARANRRTRRRRVAYLRAVVWTAQALDRFLLPFFHTRSFSMSLFRSPE